MVTLLSSNVESLINPPPQIWGWFGFPYERSQIMHKIVGRLAYYGVIVHVILMFATWDDHGRRFDDEFSFMKVREIELRNCNMEGSYY
jgi:hypothetical protein